MKFSPDQIVATVVATSFAAGLNVYATVATLGLEHTIRPEGRPRKKQENRAMEKN